MKKIKTSHKRYTLFLIIIFALIVGHVATASTKPEYRYEVVQSGDTLWGIAARNKRDGEDIRKIVYEIRSINKLKSANIYPGQYLQVPEK